MGRALILGTLIAPGGVNAWARQVSQLGSRRLLPRTWEFAEPWPKELSDSRVVASNRLVIPRAAMAAGTPHRKLSVRERAGFHSLLQRFSRHFNRQLQTRRKTSKGLERHSRRIWEPCTAIERHPLAQFSSECLSIAFDRYCDVFRSLSIVTAMSFDVFRSLSIVTAMSFDVFRSLSIVTAMSFDVFRCLSIAFDVFRSHPGVSALSPAMSFDVFRSLSMSFDRFRCLSIANRLLGSGPRKPAWCFLFQPYRSLFCVPEEK